MDPTTNCILRLPEVKRRTAMSRSSIYAMIAAGTFPRAVRLGAKSVGWYAAEVAEWIATRTRVGADE